MATVASTEPRDATTERERTWLRLSGLIYVGAWVVGLLVAPSALARQRRTQRCMRSFVHHHWSTLIQAGLVHGIAAVALAAFAVLLARRLRPGTSDATRTLFLGAAVAAVVVSLIQFGLEIGLNRHIAASTNASTTASLFHAVNIADTVKLVLLGVAVAAAARLGVEIGALPNWLVRLGYALLPILILGGLAFVVDSAVLSAVQTYPWCCSSSGSAPSA